MDFEALAARISRDNKFRKGTGASADDIRKAESALDLKIAGGYRHFLETFGWVIFSYSDIYGLGSDVPKYLDLVAITFSERTEMRPKLRPHLIPVMNDGAGNLFCIDTLQSSQLPIVFWDHDMNEDQNVEYVSDNFEEWLYNEIYSGGF